MNIPNLELSQNIWERYGFRSNPFDLFILPIRLAFLCVLCVSVVNCIFSTVFRVKLIPSCC
jgi:hypothetical protein